MTLVLAELVSQVKVSPTVGAMLSQSKSLDCHKRGFISGSQSIHPNISSETLEAFL